MGIHRIYHSRSIPENGGGLFADIAGYSDAQTDALLDAATGETNPEARAAIYRRFECRVADQVPNLWLRQQRLHALPDRRLVTPADGPWVSTCSSSPPIKTFATNRTSPACDWP
jgi:peptide/nickel transport system substrate-binding protein